jgi:hypothetical protein
VDPEAKRRIALVVLLAGTGILVAGYAVNIVPVAGLGGSAAVAPGQPVTIHYQSPSSWALSILAGAPAPSPDARAIPGVASCTSNCTIWEITWTASQPVGVTVAWCATDPTCATPKEIASGSGTSGRLDFFGEHDDYYRLSATGPATVAWGFPNGNVVVTLLVVGLVVMVTGAALSRHYRAQVRLGKENHGSHPDRAVAPALRTPDVSVRRQIVRSYLGIELPFLFPLISMAVIVAYFSSLPGLAPDASVPLVVGAISSFFVLILLWALLETRRELHLVADRVSISSTGVQGYSASEEAGAGPRPELAVSFAELSDCCDANPGKYGGYPAHVVATVSVAPVSSDSVGALLGGNRHRSVYVNQPDLERIRTGWDLWKQSEVSSAVRA